MKLAMLSPTTRAQVGHRSAHGHTAEAVFGDRREPNLLATKGLNTLPSL